MLNLIKQHLLRYWPILLTCISCSLITIWLWFPGIIHDDVMAEYMQAMGRVEVSDWHPPLLVRLWQLEIWILHTPKLFNATYIILFSIGIYLLLYKQSLKLSITITILAFLFPVCFVANGWLYKDVLVSDLLLLTIGIIVKSLLIHNEVTHRTKVLGICILLIASFLRFNAIFAVAPIIILLIMNWEFDLYRVFGSLGIVILSLLITPFVNHTILMAKPDHAITSLQTFDLGGIAWQKLEQPNSKVIFKNWKKATTEQKLAVCYTPDQWDNYGVWEPEKLKYLHNSWDSRLNRSENIVKDNLTTETIECQNIGNQLSKNPRLTSLWMNTIREHPFIYLKHRWKHFSFLIGGIGHKQLHLHASTITTPGLYDLDWVHTREIQHIPGDVTASLATRWIKFPAHILEIGGVWLLLSILLFFSSLKSSTPADKLINCLMFSSLAYITGFFFVGVGGLLRYFLPAIYLVLVTLIIKVLDMKSSTKNLSNP